MGCERLLLLLAVTSGEVVVVDLRRLGVGAVAVGDGGGGAAEGVSVGRVGAAHYSTSHRTPRPRLPVHQRVEHLAGKEREKKL